MTLLCFGRNGRRVGQAGNVSVIFAVTLPILIGAAGLGADVGYWYYKARSLQSAADAAAYDGMIVLKGGGTSTSITSAATTGATANGWSSSGGTIAVHSPPTSGTHQNAYSVQVTLTQSLPRFFSAIYSGSNVPASATSVATYAGSKACILALSPNANQAITVSGGSALAAPNCDVVSDSNASNAIDMSGSATMTANCIVSVGTASTTSGLTLNSCTNPTNHALSVADPYSSVAQPSLSGTCLTVPNGATTLPQGWYCHGLSTSWGPITFSGLYIVSGGGLNFNAGTNATGTGVTFFVAAGQTLAISGSAVVNFSAPTTGTYAGLLFFGDRSSTNGNNNISGSSSSTLNGTIYFPANELTYSGGAANGSTCTTIVAKTITISGTANFNGNNCSSGTNVADSSPGSMRLVE